MAAVVVCGIFVIVPIAGFSAVAATPTILAAVALGLGVSIVLATGPIARGVERNISARFCGGGTRGARRPNRSRLPALPIAVVFAMFGAMLVGTAAWLFWEPATQAKTVQQPRFEHAITLGYVAYGGAPAVPTGAVTAETLAQTGAQPPLYSPLLSRIDFGFSYDMTSPKPLTVTGYGGVALRIEAADGWERTIALLPSRPLAGSHVTMWATLDLEVMRSVISGVEFATGSHSSWYDVTIVPVVRLTGDLGGEHIDETYGPEFRWRYDSARITPDAALRKSEQHNVPATIQVARQLAVFGLSMRVSVVRWLALMAGLVAAGCAAAAMAWTRRGGERSVGAPTRMQTIVSFMTPSQIEDAVAAGVGDEPQAR